MADKSKQNPQDGRLNVLVMKSKGEVTNLSASPFILIFALVFALAFTGVSVFIINKYNALYYDYQELTATHRVAAEELKRLRDFYSYQSAVAAEYAKIMNAMNRADPQNGQDVSVPAIGALPPAEEDPEFRAGEAGEARPVEGLEDWAALFPDPAASPEQKLDIGELRVSGRNFRFQLVNEGSGGDQAQGRMLMVFLIEDEQGRPVLRTYPEFDLNSKEPDFNDGPGYNIRSSKQINGRLELPAGGVIREMMAVVKSRDGQVVLKKKIAPVE